MKCDSCATESDFDAAFVTQPATLGRPSRRFCPACWVKHHHFRQAWFLPSLLVGGIFGVLIDRWAPDLLLGRFIMTLCFTGLFLVLTIVPHELGHVVVARALGWHVYQVVIGIGKPLFKARWFEILVDFRSIPLAGATWMAPRNTHWFRLKLFLAILAGPLVNAGLAAAVVLVEQGNLRNFDLDTLPMWARLFLFANVFVLVVNLWPHEPKSGFGLPTDGKQMLQLLSFKGKAIEQVEAMRFVFKASICRDRADLQGARSWCDKGLAMYPDNFHLLNMSGVVHLDGEEYEKAREIFLRLLKRENQPPATCFLFSNNLAYADALSENPELLPEADAYSQAAYAGLPWMPAIVGTRGTVLVAMGKYDEGIELLKTSTKDAYTARSKAENACQIAMALCRIGKMDEARKYLSLAHQLDPKCPLINRAEKAVGDRIADRL